MDLKKTKQEVADLKEKAIDKFTHHFNQYGYDELLDEYEKTKEYFLFKPRLFYDYWMSIAVELNDIIESIYPDSELFDEIDKEIEILLLECVELKSFVDEKLYHYGSYDNQHSINIIGSILNEE